MNKNKWFVLVIIALFAVTLVGPSFAAPSPAAPSAEAQALASMDWKVRHTFEEIEALQLNLAKEYPKLVKTYSVGHSWRERNLWVSEITSVSNKPKTAIAVIGNIHGGEQESGESAAYTAMWLATNYETDKTVKEILDNYIVYVLPVMNPDGYVQSFTLQTRQNMRPVDANADGQPHSDPYTDVNGDGFISTIYQGPKDAATKDLKRIGMESPDWDENGKFGDDPKQSNIDLNRTFDYMYNRRDVDTDPVLGGDALSRAGHDAASEPEVQAVQNFLISHPVHALVTLHTGEQSVLYPWCWTNERVKDYDFLKGVAQDMIAAYEATTGRPAYEKQSFDDYPTAAEMIDWAYGKLGIHAYTMEVYTGGIAATSGDDSETHTWGNTLPEEKWEYVGDWNGQKDIWFRTTSNAQMAGVAPVDQDKLVAGVKDAIVVMIQSEPHGDGPVVPEYLLWEK